MQNYKDKIDFFNYLKANYSNTSAKVYARVFEKIEEMEIDDPDQIYKELIKKKSTNANNYIRGLNAYCKFKGTEKKYKQIRIKVEDKKEKEDYLTEAEVQELIKTAKTNRIKAEISILYGTGIRVKELTGLKHSNLVIKSESENTIEAYFIDFIRKGNKKGQAYFRKELKYLFIYFQNYLVWKESNEIYSKYTRPEDYIFCDGSGKRLTEATIWYDIKTSAKVFKGKKSISPHTLRHSFTHKAMLDGIDLVAISQNLGHASTQITEQVYAHIDQEIHLSRAFGNGNKAIETIPQANIEILERPLAETKRKCPNCGFDGIEKDFHLCPLCKHRFFYQCKCTKLVKAEYNSCPYCGRDKELAMVETIRFYQDQAVKIMFEEENKILQQLKNKEITMEEYEKRVKKLMEGEIGIIEYKETKKEGDKNGN